MPYLYIFARALYRLPSFADLKTFRTIKAQTSVNAKTIAIASTTKGHGVNILTQGMITPAVIIRDTILVFFSFGSSPKNPSCFFRRR